MTFPFSPSSTNIDPETIPVWELHLSIEECKILYKLIEHQYISYTNEEAHILIRRVINFLKEHDK